MQEVSLQYTGVFFMITFSVQWVETICGTLGRQLIPHPSDAHFQGCILTVVISFLAINLYLLLVTYKMGYSLCRHRWSRHQNLFSKQCCHLLIFNWKRIFKSFAFSEMHYVLSKHYFYILFSMNFPLPWASSFKCHLLIHVSSFLHKALITALSIL